MRVLPTNLASQVKFVNEKLQRYGRSRWWGIFSRRYEDIVQAWTENDVARLKAEVLNFDNQYLIGRFFARFFSYVEHKRALLCYYEATQLMHSLVNPQETPNLVSWAVAPDVPLVWSSRNQVQRLSGYSRLSVVAKSLLEFIQELTNHFAPATPQVVLVATNVESHFADDPTPPVAPVNVTRAASSVDAFEGDLAIFSALCKKIGVSEVEVKRAYLKLAVSYHPDKDLANPKSSENMQRLVKCYGEFKLFHEPQVYKKSI